MTIFSLYVYDRHCTCVYYHDWHRTKRPKPASKDGLLPAVSRAVSHQGASTDGIAPPMSSFSSPRNTLISSSGVVVAVNEEPELPIKLPSSGSGVQTQQPSSTGGALAFDEEAKLVYGVILSLRTMIKKLSKRYVSVKPYLKRYSAPVNPVAIHSDENFTAYRTSTYKLHLYETPSLYKFVLLTDPKIDGPAVRFALRQVYAGPFLEYAVRNPLIQMDSRERGIDNEYFRASVDRLMRGQAFFN
ncbi:TRAPP complex subunit bet5 [Sanghuangporus baumii]|uniref:Trafficking protein particle complex subunit n=1 Tax=Sanghuangporus baumii TaxID=108892 RepID=A0A9Q5HYV6_SANBA|nr:TRAPP complex subunit bet5 [Sanghuangporus baumii]